MAVTKLDDDQMRAVRCDTNVVVAAGAGSGKTTVLARRYLRLISEGLAGVENILALTFTRKAAAEMHERIYRLLHSEAGDANVLDADGNVLDALRAFDSAQISTLDSFCHTIVRNWPQRFGIPVDFSVDDDGAREQAEMLALSFVLERAEEPDFKRFVYGAGLERVWKEFFASMAVEYLTIAEPSDFASMLDKQKSILDRHLAERLTELRRLLDEILTLDPNAGKTIAQAQDHLAGLSLPDEAAVRANPDCAVSAFSSLKLVKRGGKKPDLARYKELAVAMEPTRDALIEIAVTLADWDHITAIAGLCESFQAIALESRRSSGRLTYRDVVAAAYVTLLENIDLRRHLKNRYRYIMIDEFQDNNGLQKDLLYLLAERADRTASSVPGVDELEPDKLFFVGDEKQSIYLFRGADVSVFKRLSSELTGAGGSYISLPTNYRSAPGLIAWFNTVFERVMADPQADYEARFEQLRAGIPAAPIPHIRFLYKPHDEDTPENAARSDQAEAFAVARFIRSAVAEKRLMVGEAGDRRPAGYSDIAVLMRSTSSQITYERALRYHHIPYTVDSARSLFMEAPLPDIYAFLQLAVYPEDRGAYAAVLRSPLVNVADTTLVKLLLRGDGLFFPVAADLEPMDVADRRKLAGARRIYAFLLEQHDRLPVQRLVHRLWYGFGYRYSLLKRAAHHGYLEFYDYLRRLAADADERGRTLAQFLDDIRPNLGTYQRMADLDIVKREQQGVQVMTIHKAKGLEFPVVVLANTGNVGMKPSQSSPYYVSPEYGLTIGTVRRSPGARKRYNYFYTLGMAEYEERELAEMKRLLYVAMTRAQSHLVVTGSHTRNNRNTNRAMLNMLLAAVGVSGEGVLASGLGPEITVEAVPNIDEDLFYRSPDAGGEVDPQELALRYLRAPVVKTELRRTDWTATEIEGLVWDTLSAGALGPEHGKEATELPAIASDASITDHGVEQEFGTLCHEVLRLMIEGGYRRERLPLSLCELLRETAGADGFDLLTADAERMGRAFLASPFYRDLTAGASTIDAEVPFLYRYNPTADPERGDVYVSGQIDLLVLHEDHSAVVDFKTDRVVRPGEYYTQLELYRRAAAEWNPGEVRCYLCFLRDLTCFETRSVPLPVPP